MQPHEIPDADLIRSMNHAGNPMCWEIARRYERLSAWAKANNMLDERGEPRKILGTLPVTADGCVIGQEASVWFFDDDGKLTTALTTAVEADNDDDRYHLFGHDCYSTREAAERAAKGDKDE